MNVFFERYKQLFGKDFEGLDKFVNYKLPQSIRVNTLKIDEKKLLERLQKEGVELEKIPFVKNGYYVKKSRFSLGAAPEYLFGYYYLQESAAQVPAEVLDPKPGETILDCCAAPGGKTTQLSQLMQNKGTIIALDVEYGRLRALQNHIERMGCKNIVVFEKDASKIAEFVMKFDRILLDAPCSGNFLSEKGWLEKRNIKDFEERSKIQKELMKSALNALKSKGTLVYSTCSIEPEENESVIQYALDGFNVELEDIKLKIGSKGLTKAFNKEFDKSMAKTIRFLPNNTKTQGFFVAKMRKL